MVNHFPFHQLSLEPVTISLGLVALWLIVFALVSRKLLTFGWKAYHLPGPTPFPIRCIGNLFQLPAPQKIIERCHEWFQVFGPCYLVSVFNINFVVVADATIAKNLLSSQELGHLSKASMYKFLSEIDGLAFTNGREWRTMRKLTASVFRYTFKENHIDLFNRHADTFVSSLATSAGVNNKHSIPDLIGEFAIKIIIDTYISGNNAYTKEDIKDYMKNFKIFNEITMYRILHPWLAFQSIWKFHYRYARFIGAVKGMKKFAEIIIVRHMKFQESDRIPQESCTGEKISLIDTMKQSGFSNEDIEGEITGLLFAHETNTLAAYYFLYMLALNVGHQEKCRKEVDQVVTPQTDFISFESLSKLKYTERCLLEALRLLPPVFIFGRKLDSKLALDNGVTLSPGTNVLVSPLTMHKNSEYFPNPEVFDPDRFLPEECHKRHTFAYLPFSGGPRQCLGMKSAIMEIKIMTAKILRQFYISTEDKLENLTFRLALTMFPEKEIDLTFTPRCPQKTSQTL